MAYESLNKNIKKYPVLVTLKKTSVNYIVTVTRPKRDRYI